MKTNNLAACIIAGFEEKKIIVIISVNKLHTARLNAIGKDEMDNGNENYNP